MIDETKSKNSGTGRKRKIVARAESIREEAWRQIAEHGPSALSLRAIARALGVTAPAIYNYYHRRDDLVTALIAEGFSAFGESQAAAVEGLHPGDHAGALLALGTAYRNWALAYPERFQLIFASPYPGYEIPTEQIGPIAGRTLYPLVQVLESARAAGKLLKSGAYGVIPDSIIPNGSFDLYGSAHADVLVAAVLVWTRVHGAVSVEIGQQFPPFIQNPEELYRAELQRLVQSTIGESNQSFRSTRRGKT